MNSKKYTEFINSSGINKPGKRFHFLERNSLKMSVLVDMNSEKVCMVR